MRIRGTLVACFAVLVFHLQVPSLARGQDVAAGAPYACLFDTGTASAAVLAGDALSKRAGWTRLPAGEVAHKFKGDAVILNNRIAVVFRRAAPGAQMYANGAHGMKKRALVRPAAAGLALKLSSVKIVENDPGGVTVDAAFEAAGGKTFALRFRLGPGQVFVETGPRERTNSLRVEAPCRFGVLPDFFADDMLVDATELPVARIDVPSENFFLQMTGNGEAVVMSVWNAREQDIEVTSSGKGAERVLDGVEISYGKGGKIWVAVMEGAGTWHAGEIAKEDAGKVIPLDWKMPYPVQWRVDFKRTDNLIGSWEMIAEEPDGNYKFIKPRYDWNNPQYTYQRGEAVLPPERTRWNTTLGSFPYPCWVDGEGRGFLQPLLKGCRFHGPVIIYPLDRVKDTPLDTFTVIDIMRATLGVGPCRYILDLEGQKIAKQGLYTCAAKSELDAIYSKGIQKQSRAQIEKVLTDVLVFVTNYRQRIDDYGAFGTEMLGDLDAQKKAHPEFGDFARGMEKLIREINRIATSSQNIQTPDYVAGLTDEFRRTLIDYEGDDALEKCKKITEAIRHVGGAQDGLLGSCRVAVKVLRQRAAVAMVTQPEVTEVAEEIRRRTQRILRNPVHHEFLRH